MVSGRGLGAALSLLAAIGIAASSSPLVILCQQPSASVPRWLALPTTSGPGVTLRLASHPAQCATAVQGSLLGLGSCEDAPRFRLVPSRRYPTRGYNLAEINRTTGNGTGHCIDAKGLFEAQLYKCVDSANQGWAVNATTGTIRETFDRHGSVLGLSTDPSCISAKPEPKPPGPKPPTHGLFCPQYHPIGGAALYDPSGPLLDQAGKWHLWEDEGGWSNWTSDDLMHWQGALKSSTHFGGLTGSVSATPSGVFAFWPGHNKAGVGAIESAVCEDCTSGGGWSNWTRRGCAPGLTEPTREKVGSFRDPARAFLYEGSWFVGVGTGQSVHDPKNGGGAVNIFRATNDSLAEFSDAGTLYRTNHSTGSFSKGTVVFNRSHDIGFNMIECPDIFELGGSGSWVLLASIAHGGGPNQWWTGELKGDPPRFIPTNVGVLDYGNGYAAKTGSTVVQNNTSRRVVFGFTGWAEPTAPQRLLGGGPQAGCGRYLVMPRELTVQSNGLHVDPVPETAVLRVAGSEAHGSIGATEAGALVKGAQLEVHITCNQSGGSWPATGKVALRTLAGADGKHYTEVGWDFAYQSTGDAFYVDHTHCCHNVSAIVQRAVTQIPGAQLQMRTFVDSGMIEAFSEGVVITALVNPDSSQAGGGPPEARVSSVVSTARGVSCVVSSYRLALNASS